jgi:putative RecB family exonuclease
MPKAILTKEGLILQDPEVIAKVSKAKLSNSFIDGMLNCAAKQIAEKYLIRDLLPDDPLSPAVLGSVFHKTMEFFFAMPKEERDVDHVRKAYLQALDDPDFAVVKESKEARKWVQNCINGFWRLKTRPETVDIARMKNDWGKEVPGIELFVQGNIGEASRPTLGFIDRLRVKNDGSLIIDDWKTGKHVKDYNPSDRFPSFGYLRQQTIYAMLLEEQGYTVDSANLIYPIAEWSPDDSARSGRTQNSQVFFGKVSELPVHDKKVREKVVEDVETVSSMMDSCVERNMYDCNPKPLCSWCPLVNICPAALRIKKQNAVDSRANAPAPSVFKSVVENEDHTNYSGSF